MHTAGERKQHASLFAKSALTRSTHSKRVLELLLESSYETHLGSLPSAPSIVLRETLQGNHDSCPIVVKTAMFQVGSQSHDLHCITAQNSRFSPNNQVQRVTNLHALTANFELQFAPPLLFHHSAVALSCVHKARCCCCLKLRLPPPPYMLCV